MKDPYPKVHHRPYCGKTGLKASKCRRRRNHTGYCRSEEGEWGGEFMSADHLTPHVRGIADALGRLLTEEEGAKIRAVLEAVYEAGQLDEREHGEPQEPEPAIDKNDLD